MLNQSIYSGILDLSSVQHVSCIMSVGPWNALETNIRSTCSAVVGDQISGAHMTEDNGGWQPRTRNKGINQHGCIETNIPHVCW